MLGDLAGELLASPREIAQLLDRRGRDEAAADQPMREQIGDPCGIADVGLTTWHVAHVLGVGEHELEVALEHMPHGLPVHARGFHGDMRAGVRCQPLRKSEQAARRRGKAAHLRMPGRRNATNGCDHDVLVNVEPSATRVENLHRSPPLRGGVGEEPTSSKSTRRAPGPRGPWRQFGVLVGLRVQLLNGLWAPSKRPTSVPTPPPILSAPYAQLHPAGSAMPMRNY